MILNIFRHFSNASKKHSEILIHSHSNDYIKTLDNVTSAGEDVEKLEPSFVAQGNIKRCRFHLFEN